MPESTALRTYLNDHLGGSTLGLDHARQLEDAYDGKPFGPTMSRLAQEIEEDRDTLVDLMDKLEITRNPVKAAGAWVAEKAGRVKFSGATTADQDTGTFQALEVMSLGVEGKLSLWTSLKIVADEWEALSALDLDRLIQRAAAQRIALEEERRTLAARVLAPDAT